MSSSSENEFDIEGISDIIVNSDSDSYLSGERIIMIMIFWLNFLKLE